ncbi:SURF1 family protein [Dyella agri]|uniref:SURF1-like protein n=1 Tax=Dyella agri TaxID=1926869 RepID=A0ABW8KFN8_9GAMM
MLGGFRRPPWWAILLTAVAAVLFVRLGVWQLHRAAFKDDLLRRYAAAAVASPQGFAAVAAHPPPDAYPRVQLQGRYLADRIYLLDNPKHDDRGGVEVYVPLRVPGADRLLLADLGFLPGNGTDQTPQLPPLPEDMQDLHGLYLPPPGQGFAMGGNALARQAHWPKKTIYLDLQQVAADLGAALYPRVVSLDADPASIYVRVHALDFGDMPPARHRAYAFQWFSFAIAVVVILLVLNRRRGSRKSRPMDSR